MLSPRGRVDPKPNTTPAPARKQSSQVLGRAQGRPSTTHLRHSSVWVENCAWSRTDSYRIIGGTSVSGSGRRKLTWERRYTSGRQQDEGVGRHGCETAGTPAWYCWARSPRLNNKVLSGSLRLSKTRGPGAVPRDGKRSNRMGSLDTNRVYTEWSDFFKSLKITSPTRRNI